jgi:hypothetical protein
MSDERTKTLARNHAMYRQVNERLEDVNEAFGEISSTAQMRRWSVYSVSSISLTRKVPC